MTRGEPIDADLKAWDPWAPAECAARLAGVDARWCVVGGWALDLFVGETTRAHGDLEIAVPREEFAPVRDALADYEFFIADSGKLWPLDTSDELFNTRHQTWVRDPATMTWKVDVMREPGAVDTWVFRRDERIRRPYADVVLRTTDGIPFMRPDLALLFKARDPRAKDDADFARVAPLLAPDDKHRLAETLVALYGDTHRWLDQLRR